MFSAGRDRIRVAFGSSPSPPVGGGRRLVRLLTALLCVGVVMSGSAGAAHAAVSDTITFAYDGKNVRVKIYSYNNGDGKDHPVFKYADLLNRAIKYKRAYPATAVRVKFAMYKMGYKAYVGFDPSHSSYGWVKGYDHGGSASEKLAWSIVKAAKNRVHVDFVYHEDYSTSVSGYINGFMDDPTYSDSSKQVRDFLRMKRVAWGSTAAQQMHAKFMTVSHYMGDTGAVFRDTTYITTTNINDHDDNGKSLPTDLVNSGVMISRHSELAASHNRYFNLIYQHAEDQSAFHSAVRAVHAAGALNYHDRHFSSYFTPIPLGNSDGWDPQFNPVAKHVEEMAGVSGNRYFKANVYHLKTDSFGQRLYYEMRAIYDSSSSGEKHFRWVVRKNSNEANFSLNRFNEIGIIKHPRLTHAKNVQFALSGVTRYYVVTGSTNLKQDAYVSKANASVVIKEYTTAHPVYNEYKLIYQYEYY